MHSNNIFKKYFFFFHNKDIGMIIFTVSLPKFPPTPFININKFTFIQLFFFSSPWVRNICRVPISLILLSVTFRFLQSIALRANFKKGDQNVSQTEIRVLYKNAAILIKTSTSESKKRDGDQQLHTYAKPYVYAKT